MKRFLFRILLFFIPFIISIMLFEILYNPTGGDLVKVSLIPFEKDYRNIFKNDKKIKNLVVNISDLSLQVKNNYDVLTIGDSFSNQGNIGYQNYLSHRSNLTVLHFDAWKYDIEEYNPMQFLNDAINGDLLDNLKVNYIILEVVERATVNYYRSFNTNTSITVH